MAILPELQAIGFANGKARYYAQMHHVPHGRFVIFSADKNAQNVGLVVRYRDDVDGKDYAWVVVIEGTGSGYALPISQILNHDALDVTDLVERRIGPAVGLDTPNINLPPVYSIRQDSPTSSSFYLGVWVRGAASPAGYVDFQSISFMPMAAIQRIAMDGKAPDIDLVGTMILMLKTGR